MASLMFRAKVDNRLYPVDKKLPGHGTWYVFYYDVAGKKVRQRIGANKRTAELARGDIEARIEKQRAGLLDPTKELRLTTLAEYRQQLPEYLRIENKASRIVTRYTGVFEKFCSFVAETEPFVKRLDQIEASLLERYKDHRRTRKITPNGHPNARERDGVTVRTLNNELMFLQTVLNLAQRRAPGGTSILDGPAFRNWTLQKL